MPQLPVLDNELTRRIERLVAPEPTGAATNLDPSRPIVVQFGRTIASKAKGGRPSNKVFCFGLEDVKRLDAILGFYASDALEPTFYLAPTGLTIEVAEALSRRGFSQREFRQAILYGVPTPAPPLPPGLAVERVAVRTLGEFVQATADGFEWPDAWRDGAMEGIRSNFRPDAHHFLVRWEGQAVGVGSLGVRDDVASLEEGAVMPEFRGRGCHLALLNHRLQVALDLGCELVLGAADFGSGSFRNQQRVGLRLAYIESGWRRAEGLMSR